ncbi:MAG TPA: hypothetical protein VFS76_13475 [Pyrinomonadaceae bacterium]|nr:hypothetical protein [Pyrinomonadaceae bacterium]
MIAGHVEWPRDRPVWKFDFRLSENPDSEGIAFTNVFFKNHLVLFKASLPMIRVHYDPLPFWFFYGINNPNFQVDGRFVTAIYKDSLSANNAYLFAGLNLLVHVRASEGVTREGVRFVAVESAHTIGAYRLTNRWIFQEDGIIAPQLWSAGLRHPANHRHHVYWRFDFDIDGARHNVALSRYDWWPSEWGWGPGWRPIANERSFTRPSCSKIAIHNTRTRRGYHVVPGPFDGQADGFSTFDFTLLRYHADEDRHGLLGSPISDQLGQHFNNESTEEKDIVLWYCAHLSHEVSDDGDEWHVCGPILFPIGF